MTSEPVSSSGRGGDREPGSTALPSRPAGGAIFRFFGITIPAFKIAGGILLFGVALEKIGVAPVKALVVGDTVYDIDAALRAGIAAVGVTSGPFDERQLKEAGAIAVFPNVASLLRDFDRTPLAR